MTEGAYSAGTIFLQVVPVFGDLQNKVRGEAKKLNRTLGDEMEQGGADAGGRAGDALNKELEKKGKEGAKKYNGAFADEFRSSMRGLSKELGNETLKVTIKAEDEDVQRTFAEIKAKVKELRNAKVGIKVDARDAAAELAKLELQLRLLHEQATNVQVKADLKTARANVESFVKEIQRHHPEMKIEADFKGAQRQLGDFEKRFSESAKRAASKLGDSINPEIRRIKEELDTLSDAHVGVDIDDAEAQASIEFLIAELDKIDGDTLEIHAKANVGKALAELGLLHAEMRAINGEHIEIKANSSQASKSLGDTGNNFRALNGLVIAAITLLPALVPIFAAVAGGALALGPALAGVGAGLGVMILGFSGIGAAVQAISQQQKTAAKDADASAKRIQAAARGVADSERGLANARRSAAESNIQADQAVADARRSSAQSNVQAAQSVADAERSSARSVQDALKQRADAVRSAASADRDAADAQKALQQARRDAQKDLQDNKDKQAQNKLDERQGVIDVFQATVDNVKTQQDGSATNLQKEQASINLSQAQLRLKMIREQAKELAKQNKEGVAGSQKVQSAQDTLTSAIQRQADAHRAVGEASKAVDRARVDGARQVQRAIESQQQTQANGARSVQRAIESQQQTQASGQRAIADAQRNLVRSQQDYRDALDQTSASASAVDDAMSKLGPAGRHFVHYLVGLKDKLYAIRDAAQQGMLPGVEDAMNHVMTKSGPRLLKFVRRMGKALGDSFRELGDVLTGPNMSEFFSMLSRLGPKFTRTFTKIVLTWMEVFARLMVIAAPWAVKFSDALLAMSDNALKFVNSKKGTKVITDFLSYAEKVGPKVWQFFKDLVDAIINLGVALAPVGELILGALDGFLKWIAGMDPKNLQTIVLVVATLVVLFQALNATLVLFGMFGAIMAALEVTGAAVALAIVAVVVLVVAAFAILYFRSALFRKIVHIALHAIGDAFSWLWNKVIKPVGRWIMDQLHQLGQVAQWLWKNVIHPVFTAIGAIFGFVARNFHFMWVHFFYPVLSLFAHVVGIVLWKMVLKPIFTRINNSWDQLARAFHNAWVDYIKPALDKFGELMGGLWKTVQKGANKIGDIWDGVKKKMASPINWVIRTVFNEHLIAGFNKVARFVHSKEMPTLKEIPQKNYATGGILPGYTPGRDVHHFVSPTGGVLNLSGGEPIMRPEFGKVVGRNWINRMNDAARRKGVKGVQQELGFATGGIYYPGANNSFMQGSDGGGNGSILMDGKRISIIAARQIRLAERLLHTNLRIMQGGYGGSHIAASGSSHNYPGVADISPGSIRVETMLRKVGFAAWARNIAGRSSVGSGAHVHAVSLLDPGDARSPQVYGSWAHHGNGLSGANNDPAGHPKWIKDLRALLGNIKTSALGGGGDGKGGGGGFSLPGWIGKILSGPMHWAKNLVHGPLSTMFDKFKDSGITKFLDHSAHNLLEGVADKAKSLIDGFGGAVGRVVGTITGTGGTGLGAGAQAARTIIRQMASTAGWGSGRQWHALDQLIASESSWNPNAHNAHSSAAGLFQKMTSLHGPLEKTIQGQGAWGLNYIKNRYGDPIHAWAYHVARGSYKDGGVVGDQGELGEGGNSGLPSNGTMMYDNGGYLPPGITQVVNLTGKPEPVFTADQFKNLGNGGGGQGGSTYNYAPTFNQSDLTAEDVTEDMLYGFTVLTNRGKYGRA